MRAVTLPISRMVVWSAVLCSSQALLSQSISGKLNAAGAAGATLTPHMAFDVASIRESGDGNWSYINNPPQTGSYRAERVAAAALILGAYDLNIFKVLRNLPEWAWSSRYDVSAKSDSATDEAIAKLSDSDSYAEKRHMLQLLLAERFHLQIHAETKISTTYELLATARSAKLMKPVQDEVSKTVGTCSPHYSQRGFEVDTTGCPFTVLLSDVRQELGTNVLDRTGMTGVYAYHLMWRPSSGTQQSEENWFPSIGEAIREQLGLELKPTKGPVTFWVVDHIERPTSN